MGGDPEFNFWESIEFETVRCYTPRKGSDFQRVVTPRPATNKSFSRFVRSGVGDGR